MLKTQKVNYVVKYFKERTKKIFFSTDEERIEKKSTFENVCKRDAFAIDEARRTLKE